MQTTYLAQPFYNFLNQFSYNFERSDHIKNKRTMKKKAYQVPSIKEVKIQTATIIAVSNVNSVSSGDTGIGYGGGGSGDARSRGFGGFDDGENED